MTSHPRRRCSPLVLGLVALAWASCSVEPPRKASAGAAVALYIVTAEVTGGHGTLHCLSLVVTGQPASCTATPAPGYHLVSLTDGDTDVLGAASANRYTIVSVTRAHTVTATFASDSRLVHVGESTPPGA